MCFKAGEELTVWKRQWDEVRGVGDACVCVCIRLKGYEVGGQSYKDEKSKDWSENLSFAVFKVAYGTDRCSVDLVLPEGLILMSLQGS